MWRMHQFRDSCVLSATVIVPSFNFIALFVLACCQCRFLKINFEIVGADTSTATQKSRENRIYPAIFSHPGVHKLFVAFLNFNFRALRYSQ